MSDRPPQPMRWQIRRACDALGLACRLSGGPVPGRRIGIRLADGAVVCDEDRSARWRGTPLWIIRPAVLDAPLRQRLTELSLALARALSGSAGLDLEFTIDDDDLALTAARTAIPTVAVRPGWTAFLRLGEPAAGAGEVRGTLMDLRLPTGADSAFTVGDAIAAPAGTILASLHAADRAGLAHVLAGTAVAGVPTSLGLLRQAIATDPDGSLTYTPAAIEVLAGGLHTTVQDWPGRLGAWAVGVPPSGPMDDLAFRLANRLVGNAEGAPGLEITLAGPTLRFHAPAIIAIAGCPVRAELDGVPVVGWRACAVPAGGVLRIHGPTGGGVRCALAIRGGLDVAPYLGSAATFDLGGFGGVTGRPLAAGDWLPLSAPAAAEALAQCPGPLPAALRPAYPRTWELGVLEGPHAAPDFLTQPGIDALYAATWTVHQHSNRTGIRLSGPRPLWARRDGGEAGLHPSNIHDNAYAFGAIDLTGDMPIILGPDGPSCGGFVCPAVVCAAERWKLGQLRPGDQVRLRRLAASEADRRRDATSHLVATLTAPPPVRRSRQTPEPAVLLRRPARGSRPSLCLRRSGDEFLLLEYGEPVLDLALRLRAELLLHRLRERDIPGIIDITPGVRSLQVHHDPGRLPQSRLADLLAGLDEELPDAAGASVPSRTIHLPLSWDDPETRKAIAIYMRSVRPDAPWCPWNIEFIRRINGLASVEEVKRIVFAADYLVLGLGDVYLGAPVATPVDPRHRLVTTKYNPARTWTPENAVGIGGAYLCIYGMEGPGGYQFVGRTVPVWNSFRRTPAFPAGSPWLLRNFDRIRWYEVAHDELPDLRADLRAGRWQPRCEEGVFDGGAYASFLAQQAADISAFQSRQRTAFAAERERWARAKEGA